MIMPISYYKNLYVADVAHVDSFSNKNEMLLKIIFSHNNNFIDGKMFCPFVKEVETGCSILASNSKHVKNLSYYVNSFGFPRKHILEREKDRQRLVVEEIKYLRKLGKI